MSLPLAMEEVFAFFAAAQNLERITPPELSFHLVSPAPLEIGKEELELAAAAVVGAVPVLSSWPSGFAAFSG